MAGSLKKAITLVELILAVSLIAVIVLAGWGMNTAAHRFFFSMDSQALRQREANFALQHMVRNIKWGESFTILEGGKSVRVRLNGGNQIRYQKVSSEIRFTDISGNVETIASNIESMNFIDLGENPDTGLDSLGITVTTQADAQRGISSITYNTAVTLRYSF